MKRFRKVAKMSKNGSISLRVQKLSTLDGSFKDISEFALTGDELRELVETYNDFVTNSDKTGVTALIGEWDNLSWME